MTQGRRIDNAKVIVPLAVGLWLAISLLSRYGGNHRTLLGAIVAVAALVGIPAVIAYLIAVQSGWRDLARRYPLFAPSTAAWRTCRTAIVSSLGKNEPGYQRSKVRLNFIVRVRSDGEALYVSTVRFLAPVLPPLRIPWSAIARVRYFVPSGWNDYSPTPGTLFQLNYDPGYNEPFVEIQIRDPMTFLQLPVALVQEAVAHFPVERGDGSAVAKEDGAV